MIESLLPAAVRSSEAFTDRTDVVLFPEEARAVERAVDKRRREFTTVRACARDALADLGVAAAPIVPGVRGAPDWPADVVGSMTHCSGYRAASVARSQDLASIGIDAEPNEPLPEDVLNLVAVPDDLPGLKQLTDTGVATDRLLFSAKESLYKAWFPLARRWLGFHQATVALRADGTFTARVLIGGGGRLTELGGNWLAAHGLLITAISIPAS
jgi:4'-phosphopantetheinyl transferase EntD